jgi:hypothetical protein
MPLEDPRVIDVVTRPAPDALALLITDSGQTEDPLLRLKLLRTKLEAYASYVATPHFEQQYPGVARDRVTIVVVSRFEATPEMKAISSVSLPSGSISLPVKFDLFDGKF